MSLLLLFAGARTAAAPAARVTVDVGGKRRRVARNADDDLTEAEVQFMRRKLDELIAAKTAREKALAAKALEIALAQAAKDEEAAEVISAQVNQAHGPGDYRAAMQSTATLSRIVGELQRMVREIEDERDEDDLEVIAMAL